MKKIFVEPRAGREMSVTLDGIKYIFCVEDFSNIDGYAPVLIIDSSTENRHYSYGYYELNNHVFISRWKKQYDYNRDNYTCSRDLIIEII